MLIFYSLCAVMGAFLALRGAWRILDIAGRNDVFVVRSPESVAAHPEELHVGGVAAEADLRPVSLDSALEESSAQRVGRQFASFNVATVATAGFGGGGVVGTLAELSTGWALVAALLVGALGFLAGSCLHSLRRKWD